MKRRIIHIALGKANPNRPNGVNKVVNSLVSHQVAIGFNAEFWGISFSEEHDYPLRNYQTKLFLDQTNKFRLEEALKVAIHKLNPENTIIHIHGAFIPQFYALSRLLKKKSITYFFTPHGGYNLNALKKSRIIKSIYMRLFERKLVNQAQGVQLIGASEMIGTRKHFKNTFYLIPNGQEINHSATPGQSDKKLIRIGFIGRIDIRTKGLDILLDGVYQAAKHLKIQLDIMGSGEDTVSLKARVKELGLTQQVRFLGALFGDEKSKAMNNWDALCLTSRNEGLPGVVLEAASEGLPCIVSQETNMGKYISTYKAGWVLENNNAQQLKKAFGQLEDSKKTGTYLSYSAASQTMVRQEFDWKMIAEKLVSAYEKG